MQKISKTMFRTVLILLTTLLCIFIILSIPVSGRTKSPAPLSDVSQKVDKKTIDRIIQFFKEQHITYSKKMLSDELDDLEQSHKCKDNFDSYTIDKIQFFKKSDNFYIYTVTCIGYVLCDNDQLVEQYRVTINRKTGDLSLTKNIK